MTAKISPTKLSSPVGDQPKLTEANCTTTDRPKNESQKILFMRPINSKAALECDAASTNAQIFNPINK